MLIITQAFSYQSYKLWAAFIQPRFYYYRIHNVCDLIMKKSIIPSLKLAPSYSPRFASFLPIKDEPNHLYSDFKNHALLVRLAQTSVHYDRVIDRALMPISNWPRIFSFLLLICNIPITHNFTLSIRNSTNIYVSSWLILIFRVSYTYEQSPIISRPGPLLKVRTMTQHCHP